MLQAIIAAGLLLGGAGDAAPIPVTPDNFVRAESDLYFSASVRKGGFGKFAVNRQLTPIDRQTVVRINRDTLNASAVFDLDAGPVTIALPDPGRRFLSMQVLDQDHYTRKVAYEAGRYTFTREDVGTRYMLVGVRILVDPADPEDVKQAHALQDALQATQASAGTFVVPHWDAVSQKKVRDALLALAATTPDMNRAFGSRAEVDPVRRLIGAAAAWGGNPDRDAVYLTVVPERNDGETVHRLVVADVPVDGFWSISVYNEAGYFEPNALGVYSINSVTASRARDGTVAIQFGGCTDGVSNCIPIMKGWNYMVRLYRPRPPILSGEWRFPEAKPGVD